MNQVSFKHIMTLFDAVNLFLTIHRTIREKSGGIVKSGA